MLSGSQGGRIAAGKWCLGVVLGAELPGKGRGHR